MHRRLSLVWIPLLAGLLVGSRVEGTAGSSLGKGMLQALDSLSSAVPCALATPRSQSAFLSRSRGDRRAGTPWLQLSPSRISLSQLLPLPARPVGAPPAASAAGSTLFPTGPPSH